MKEMKRKIVEDLLMLSLRVMDETNHCVIIDIGNYGYFITVYAMENGFRKGSGFDKVFHISENIDGIDENIELKETKTYLNKLLREQNDA